MTLFSGPTCPQSHRARIVLAEKGITYDVVDAPGDEFPEDLLDLNPYGSVPTLVDRDLVLYYARVIIEYLDERVAQPPRLPVEQIVANGEGAEAEQARKSLRDSLTASAEVFAARPYFLSEDFSLVDCTIAPVLWRLPILDIELPAQAASVAAYAARIFERDSFRNSLSDAEREMRA